jgi:hypothetical protein
VSLRKNAKRERRKRRQFAVETLRTYGGEDTGTMITTYLVCGGALNSTLSGSVNNCNQNTGGDSSLAATHSQDGMTGFVCSHFVASIGCGCSAEGASSLVFDVFLDVSVSRWVGAAVVGSQPIHIVARWFTCLLRTCSLMYVAGFVVLFRQRNRLSQRRPR